MPQRALLVVAAVLAVGIVQVVPLVDANGSIVAYGAPTTQQVLTKLNLYYYAPVRPGYGMMGAELVVLAFATGLIYVASSRKE